MMVPSTVTIGANGQLHGEELHAGLVGVVGAGLSYSDLVPIGDTFLRQSWLNTNQDGDRIWFGQCLEKPFDHWHFDRFDVAGRIRVSVNDLHTRWCRVKTSANYPLQYVQSTAFDGNWHGLIAEDLEIDGIGTDGTPGSQAGGVLTHSPELDSTIIRRCHIKNHAWGAQPRRGNSFYNCLVEDIHYFSGSHNTCMAVHGGPQTEGVKIVGCKLLGGNSAALSLYTDFGSVVDVLIQNNYLSIDTANYAFRAGEDTTNGSNHEGNRDIRVVGNVFGRENGRFSGTSAPYTEWNPDRPGALWENNRWGPRGPDWVAGDPEEGDLIV